MQIFCFFKQLGEHVSQKNRNFVTVMNNLLRLLVWVSRINHCRGFGIQSPTDYRFVRDVVNERWPYYAYESLDAEADWLEKKQGRLCLRMANALQPHTVVDRVGVGPYVQAGCRKAVLTDKLAGFDMAVLAIDDAHIEAALSQADAHSVLMVSDAWRNRRRWRQLAADARAVVTFDLYYCGIIFFDPQRAKANYTVNF